AGSAYIEEVGETTLYNNSNKDNAIQQAINAALLKASGSAFEGNSLTVVVKDGTYEGSIVVQKAYTDANGNARTYNLRQGFILYIRSSAVLGREDAALAEGGIGANVAATLTVLDGINVDVAGLYFSNANAITVTDSTHFSFAGTSGNDNAKFTLTNVAVPTIQLGSGDDIASVTLKQSKNSPQYVSVDGGVGDDQITLDIQTTKGTEVPEGSVVPPEYSVIEVDGGDGNDQITAKGAQGGAKCKVTFNGGAGDDLITLDATLQGIANDTDDFIVDGGTGADRVHLTGKIYSDAEHNVYGISGNAERLSLKTAKDETDDDGKTTVSVLNLRFANIEAYTDDLSGKKVVELDTDNNGKIRYTAALENFVTYALNVKGTATSSGQGILYSAVLTDTSNVFLSTLKLTCDQIRYVFAPALNVLAESVKIYVGAPEDTNSQTLANSLGVEKLGIFARNVILRGKDDDTNFTITVPVSEVVDQDDIVIDLSCFIFVCDGNVTIAKDAVVEASEFVSLEASSEQTHGMLPIPQINVITVKVGNAGIDVKGTIRAGASVSMTTNGVITITCDGSTLGSPIALAVAVMDNHIELDGATIESLGSVIMRATTQVMENVVSTTGLIPISLAVNVGVSYTTIDIHDSTITADGVVDARATSTLVQQAISSMPKGNAAKYESGGFFAVNVAVHEAEAIVTGSTNITAGGDVRAIASSTDKATAKAVSGTVTTSTTATTSDQTKKFTIAQITKLVPTLIDKALAGRPGAAGVGGTQLAGGIDAAKGGLDQPDAGGNEGESSEDSGKSVTKVFDTATNSAKDPKETSESTTPDPNTPDPSNPDPSNPSNTTPQATGSQFHAVGAAAITVIINSADAHVDTTGTIQADGNLVLDSSTTTIATTISDASTITKTKFGKKKNKTLEDDQTQITVKPEDVKKLEEPTDGYTIIIKGGTYHPTNAKIDVQGDAGSTVTNVGGKVTPGTKGEIIIEGGTTTFEGVGIDMNSNPAGSITWTGDAGNASDYITFQNAGTTLISTGVSDNTYKNGTAKIMGGSLVVKKGRVYIYDGTLVVSGGQVILGSSTDSSGNETPGSLTFTYDEATSTYTISGSKYGIKSATGDLTITSDDRGEVKRFGSNYSQTADAIVITVQNMGQIERIGGEYTADETGSFTGSGCQVTNTSSLSTQKGLKLEDGDVSVDVTPNSGLAVRDMKDKSGNGVKVTFNPASGTGENATPASSISLTSSTAKPTYILPNGATFTISDNATFSAHGGRMSTGSTTGAPYIKFENDPDSHFKPLTVYIEGTFTFQLTGTFKGDIDFADVTFERRGESQTGN
ncbi:MAG: hypothetical protein IJH42_00030, partial [Atopobiaceae bacterium]|nr:hypothetical protein [Atopobiaceae bacterium]